MGAMGHGRLRIYLGAAPGVGKTYAMLGEAHRRRERGADVVVAFVEPHGRPLTERLIEGLEVLPRREVSYRGATFQEMDTDAVLARRPQVALVDELAHTNVPGSRHAKRWQDVAELLGAGVDVISTLNVQHLESLNDVVASITGVPQRETIPDEVVRQADQIELVDMAPEALRRRLAHGNVYAPEKIDAALSNYFRLGNLTALRELALLWVADRVDEYLRRYRAEHGILAPWPARERVVVALTGGPEGQTLLRRAARITDRAAGGELMAVYVASGDGLTGASPSTLATQRQLAESLGGSFHVVVGDDVPGALLQFARGVDATQMVLGSSRRRGLARLLGPGVGATTARLSGEIDVHIVPHEHARKGRRRPPRRSALAGARLLAGWIFAALAPPLLTLALAASRGAHDLSDELLFFLVLTVFAALLGGLWPAVATALFGSLLLNYYFTPPLYRLTIADPKNLLAIALFVVVAVAVASVVDLAARRTSQAARGQAEAETLRMLSASVLRGERALPALLDTARTTFGMRAAALLERSDGTGDWQRVDSVGEAPAASPDDADVDVPVGDRLTLALSGRVLPADDRRMLSVFAEQAAIVLEHQRLVSQAADARRLAEANRVRTALLAAVSHDLRTPLAGIKASVSSLRSDDVTWAPHDEAELLATIEESADRLDQLVANLLDMSRVHTGSLRPLLREVALDEVAPAALSTLPADAVRLDIPDTLPAVRADPGLLERVVGNVVENAVNHAGGAPVLCAASALADRVELRVVDRGPGVADADKERIFEPFQRLGDAPRGAGVGLGLAVARGFAEAMDGSLVAEDTPGGGLTMVLSLPVAQPADPAGPAGPAGTRQRGPDTGGRPT